MQTTPASSFKYEVKEEHGEKFVVITKFIGSETEVVIPDEIDGLPVTEIGEWAFFCCTGLTSITLPKGLETIGEMAFRNCTSLKSVTLPEGLKLIGEDVFAGCSGQLRAMFPEDYGTDYSNDPDVRAYQNSGFGEGINFKIR